ncbi:transcriptional repressor AgaR [Aureimonas jatrophae]|uniref:Transcriptional regulator, DeoR family n=1 Tax=Aureimonas jatrophae TaxID=1166073 RepID=A0A1H0JNY5_9HYPH|nr:transcriptional repressor AgaR [Aureimonas jatrophae]MBB3951312.1 DeoR family transcriptional regulator of aga operon [Aureimonas jatrophae]SDO45446.1 transcriptional regulator, DeoR family [Aureimonas jatrophae]
MTGQERREAILRHLEMNERARVGDLARCLGVSTVTMRGDLSMLESTGYVVRLHGAVVLSRNAAAEIAFAERRQRHGGIKERIGEAAALLIADGDAVILDAGTTTLEIARCIKDRENLLVLTNGLDIAMELSHAPGIEVVVLGGRLRKTALSFSGAIAEEMLAAYRFDKLFLGADAISIENGIVSDNEGEARLNRAMVQIAAQVVAVADSSKAGQRGIYHVASFDEIDRLVTDDALPDAFRSEMRRRRVDLTLV